MGVRHGGAGLRWSVVCTYKAHLRLLPHSLRSYGIAYWHAKFPDWPLKIRRY